MRPKALSGIAGICRTAPGKLATHAAAHTMTSMPQAITVSGSASSPNGISKSVSSPAGITTKLQIGIAIRLAISAYCWLRWK
jgi:hypothetical protein